MAATGPEYTRSGSPYPGVQFVRIVGIEPARLQPLEGCAATVDDCALRSASSTSQHYPVRLR
jgi:hypothetical protein